MNIRNSAKALIIRDNQILLTKNVDTDGVFYLFPGGGQEHGETLNEALKRECVEEIGQNVRVGELLHLREYIGKNHEFASFDVNVHQVEFYFECELANEPWNEQPPIAPDDHQVGVEWVSIQQLHACRLYPEALKQYITKRLHGGSVPVYLGDVN
ncbi:NUDIX domain-containing protein [Aureibacillus halotolerans]|uniref:ADP-ribose pyrophosphatase YjhB (NUDIX family) n=1 Tax=Aureibacillus halotolerans TaxID=1508390 RepID=A0A4R6U7N1_9BACI|nr:NUDIX domain-containing protein [Aureibacillus halotolerans]TDQ40749.1 ADP-ribose pyrophosphatase YjhB (NUDIX family) [Aureibacillus halotolerans]